MDAATDDSQRIADALARCAKGDRAALRLILEMEGGRLLGVAHRMLRRRELAEEALQDAFVLIWRRADQYRAGEGSARGWIYAVLRNRCLNILRDGKRLSTLDREDLTALQDARQSEAVSEVWSSLGERADLRHCLMQLEEETRRSILLAHVAGYTHGEIAAILRVPLGTAKSWIRRGLDALRGCLT